VCLAIPARIERVDGHEAEVSMGGITRAISIQLTPGARPGDYVIVHAGYAINVLDQQEALETLRLFEQMARLAKEEA
jgi:hydrogenase expression/formation protein HypC